MLSYIEETLAAIEANREIKTRNAVFSRLRPLGLGDFGEVLLSMPNPAYPRLSALLPSMASPETQSHWTGSHGYPLLRQTCSFVRSLAANYTEITGRQLKEASILDYGCGYGRIARLLYYFVDVEQLYGVDPWDRSIAECSASNLGDLFRQSEYLPTNLPVDGKKFDCVISFSVFTHLSERAADTALTALRDVMKPGGILMLTIRPVEYWDVGGASPPPPEMVAVLKERHAKTGFAFQPHAREAVDGDTTYGDTSMTLGWLDRKADGWKRVGIDRSLGDPYQLYVFLLAQ